MASAVVLVVLGRFITWYCQHATLRYQAAVDV